MTRDVQMVFQDPFASLNPRKRIRQVLEVPFEVHGLADRRASARRASASWSSWWAWRPSTSIAGRTSCRAASASASASRARWR